ncbi:hypothetical protein [Acetivibrio cellulolyticus]|uniref:hypothetical protein n=1 Tax=Acetivibrio cellulolyticus TaxID=35830 RepID=UPI0001E2D553|nr:hypothetical protein [Acetivibrio cellulolyticus]
MIIESEDKKSYISIDFVEDELERIPSICVSVSVKNNDFCGRNDMVWVELNVLKGFICELERLDMNRKGIATLGSMSPEDLILTIEAYDLAGHLMLKYKLSKTMYCPDLLYSSIKGGFELDTSSFSNLVKEFNVFLQKYL